VAAAWPARCVGHVAADDHDVAVEVGGEGLERDLDRASGAGNVVLVDDRHVGVEAEDGAGDRLALVAHDGEDVGRLQRCRGGEHVADQRDPADLVQDLRTLRLHARSLTGGENDYGEIGVSHGV
jgi:hypothetical protein